MDSLGVSDIIHQRIMRTQQMSLLGKFFLSISKHRILFDDKCLVQISCAYSISVVYQPPIAISIHGQVAQVEKISIEWPKSSHRYLNLHGTLMIYKFQYYSILPSYVFTDVEQIQWKGWTYFTHGTAKSRLTFLDIYQLNPL